MTRGFHALQVRNYRLFWIGQMISPDRQLDAAHRPGLAGAPATHSPFALGLVTALQFLPVLLLSLIGGVITDRWPKHRLVTITQVAALLQAAIFATAGRHGVIQLWHVYMLATSRGIITAIDNPVRQSFVVELAGREHLINAVALNSMLFNASRIVGPAAGGHHDRQRGHRLGAVGSMRSALWRCWSAC